MIAVITGDVVNSRKIADPEIWLSKLKTALNRLGKAPKVWEIIRGDSFQLEIGTANEALREALYIKATIKTIPGLDARMAIGIGAKTYEATKISEANGEAFVYSGRLFDQLKKNTLAVKSPWQDVDRAVNICLELASLTMDRWTPNSAEMIVLSLEHPEKTQSELASMIQISQGRVSERQQRAGYEEIMKMEAYFSDLVQQKLSP
ncbi:hypothetical protein ACFOET_09680 [Parapedobacter deserti]|uniref:Transcriptional regulator n=1 Tax=Parapedobacter deserti TaxID=1912957 RepID=A0ABV7JL22_9SPHI